ncbi:hypothetical protein BKA67DRAFT_189667 [Truncatella angustata]|uniref:Uncharacterized protein n=1 Tax=Truncatella angustata TaxID=152316 RepID=A0A9P8USP3_9PEZI|nr:uncharacterized protein BKA67DRAFT_189667 [Truncatella angustata]KAH6657481.1 hypothetical protein BKA67DRAFT_189667 [Truncatella angustata]KAH8199331.1 hypothetical protein TruAng_006516 [Truncatella angustata]
MSALQFAATALPKGFCNAANLPRTPEPFNAGDEQLPFPPRPRFKLKKRNASSHLHAPTEQFLASVAAADVPIPSVEEPDFAIADYDQNMMAHIPDSDDDGLDIYHHLHSRVFSPPKTPALDFARSLPVPNFPDWSTGSTWSDSDLESSPEYESSRPSTAFSTHTASSLFSHFSHTSEDGDCISPDVDKGAFDLSALHDENAGHLSRRKPRRAPWTKAMDSHLWSTYMLYLQDPKVTPVNQGKSCIPPNGVCARVAREAKRSWRGSKQKPTYVQSGSNTPRAESSNIYMDWPHTCAATRAHLRELCKLKAVSNHSRAPYVSPTPAPFNKAAHRRWNRRSTPAPSPATFSAQDMSMSLTLSTSEAMQPQGPMALLTSSQPEPPLAPLIKLESPEADRMRLGSPFLAKSYGPSSSITLAEGVNFERQSQTLGPQKFLKSPVRLTHSRSSTQKRRSIKGLEDQPRKRRPSIAAALWGPPAEAAASTKNTVFSSTNFSENDKLFVPRTNVADPFYPTSVLDHATNLHASPPSPKTSIPTRLGSPFSSSQTSHSFPNRLSQPTNFNLSALRRPFATVQQTSDSGRDASPTRSSLSTRLAYIDQRLKELRNRNNHRRSQSPAA